MDDSQWDIILKLQDWEYGVDNFRHVIDDIMEDDLAPGCFKIEGFEEIPECVNRAVRILILVSGELEKMRGEMKKMLGQMGMKDEVVEEIDG